MEFTPLTQKQEAILNQVYYDEKFYFGRERLYAYLKQQYPKLAISSRAVGDWLKRQNLNQLFQPTRITRDIKRTVLSQPHNTVGVDLMDMGSKQADGGYKWILSGMDLFSKKGYAIPLRNKEGRTVAKGLQQMLAQMRQPPRHIRSDNGSEFIDKQFQQVLQHHHITHIRSKAGTPQSNGQVERWNGVLKRLIEMERINNDNSNWVGVLDTLVRNYKQHTEQHHEDDTGPNRSGRRESRR